MPHYSLKYNTGHGMAPSIARFDDFCRSAHSLGVREVLLVSGAGSRACDTVACLKGLSLRAEVCPQLGVAFNRKS